MYGLKKRPKDESGMIQGAGTGTSDDIKKNVPAGSYIMPADSTQKIGTDNLKNMGSPTPVNLSNGEFQLSPDQVHSVGVQTLDAMKNQTHTPVDQPQLGFKPGQNKPELFFANGGDVPDEDTFLGLKKSAWTGNALSAQPQKQKQAATVQPSSPQVNTSVVNDAPSFTDSAIDSLKSNVSNELKQGNTARAVGQGVRGGLSVPISATYDAAASVVKPVGNFFGGFFNTDNSGAAATPSPAAAKPDTAPTNNTPAVETEEQRKAKYEAELAKQKAANAANQQIEQAALQRDGQQPAGQQNQTNGNPYAIQQKGNSFSYADAGAAAQARASGIPEMQELGFRVNSAGDPVGVKNLLANTREMGASEQQIQDALARREMNIGLGMRGYGNNPVEAPQRNEAQEAERQAVIRAASTPIAGARGLTANQVRTLSDLQQGEDNRANQRYTTDANNVVALQREAMGQAGQNYRTELNEQGTNSRFNTNLGFEAQKFNATNDLANRGFNLNATEKGFSIRNSARLEKLYEQYDKAETDEQRQSIQEKINRYSGGKAESGNPYISVKRGEILDEKGNTIQPAGEVLFNRITGQTIDPLANMQSQQKSISRAEYDALPKGSQYIGEDGKSYIKG